jgi:hypothetical protein
MLTLQTAREFIGIPGASKCQSLKGSKSREWFLFRFLKEILNISKILSFHDEYSNRSHLDKPNAFRSAYLI